MREIMSRFAKYMQIKGLNDHQVTMECKLSQGLLGQARVGKSDLGKQTISKILNKYQDLNKVWLMTGEGEMLLKSPVIIDGNNNINGSGNTVHTMSGNRINISVPEKGKKKIINSEGIVIESDDALQNENSVLRQALSDKDKIISLLEDKIKSLTDKNNQ